MKKPAPLRPGDRIGLVAPASLPKDEAALDAGIANLEDLGYRIVRGRRDYAPRGYLAGSDDERLDELNSCLSDPDLEALFCVRGGYGTLRLLPGLDYEAARRHPKLVVGYSDITALQLALLVQGGVPTPSGLMVASDFADPHPAAERLFWNLLQGGTPAPLLGPDDEALHPEQPGTVEGPLIGGNLSVVCKLVGTPYLPPMDDALLFLEDVDEPPYRLDGYLAHLRLAGVFDRIGGLILGRFTGWKQKAEPPTLSLDEVLEDYLADLSCPVASGLTYGHFSAKNALPIGVRARLEVADEAAALSILEPLVR